MARDKHSNRDEHDVERDDPLDTSELGEKSTAQRTRR